MLTTKTCVVATCDSCGDGWEEWAHYPHFDSEEMARQEVLDMGWADHPMAGLLCGEYAAQRSCEERGHDWSPRRGCLCAGAVSGHLTDDNVHCIAGELRHCDRCTHAETRVVTPT